MRQNSAFVDWWMLQRFPGRTLEELDGIDWLRLQRAMQVGDVVNVEERFRMYHAKQIEHLTPAERVAVLRHDRLVEAFYPDEDDAE